MLLVLFRLLAFVPLPVLHGIGRLAGRIVYAAPGRYRQRLRSNARQAGYPDAAFARRAAAETGPMVMALPNVWPRKEQRLKKIIRDDDVLVETGRAACRERVGQHV